MSEETPTPGHSFPTSPAKDRESELQLRTCWPVPGLTPTGESAFSRSPGNAWAAFLASDFLLHPPDVFSRSRPSEPRAGALSVVHVPTAPAPPECLSDVQNSDPRARPVVSVCSGWCYKIPLGALKSRGVFSHVLEAGRSRPRCQQGCFFPAASLLSLKLHLLAASSVWSPLGLHTCLSLSFS